MLGLSWQKTGVTTDKKEKVPKRMSGKQKINSMKTNEKVIKKS